MYRVPPESSGHIITPASLIFKEGRGNECIQNKTNIFSATRENKSKMQTWEYSSGILNEVV